LYLFRKLFVLQINLNNDYASVSGEYDKKTIDLINETCSYKVPDAEWSAKFQNGTWNGKISLFSRRTMSFPAGIFNIVLKVLKDNNIKFVFNDCRPKPKIQKLAQVDLGEHSFRDYQQEAIKKIKEKTRGILAMCTGAGKTKSSCGIISELSVYPVIFVVPSVSLLKQTVSEFKSSLKPLDPNFKIGEIGGGKCDIAHHGVNVATYQTLLTAFDKKYSEQSKKVVDVVIDNTTLPGLEKQLKILKVDLENSPVKKTKSIEKKIKDLQNKISAKLKFFDNKKQLRDLVGNCQLLIIDETHIAASVIECISLKASNAYYKCGLSGTPRRLDNQDVRMFGSTGPIIHKVTSSDLIKRGFLTKPYIYIVDLDFIDKSAPSHPETYKKAIVNNVQRNELIRDFAIEMKAEGRPTLILVERLEHGKILEEMIEDCVFVPGGDGSDDKEIPDKELDYRRYQLNRLENNEIIMAATSWAYTGIDAPKISCIILACSISSPNTITQQIGRGLRNAPGKKDCVIIDFKHKEKSLRQHHFSKMKVYNSEEEFVVKILKYNSNKGTYV